MRRAHVLTATLIVFIVFVCFREWTLLPDGTTHLVFLSVGQGDSALIITPSGKHVLIDGGPDWKTLEALPHHMSFFDRTIDLLVLSHANLDHLASFPEILKRYDVRTIAISDIAVDAPWFQRITETAKSRGTTILPLHAGQTISLDSPLAFDVLWPPKKLPTSYANESNNTSLVLRLQDGAHSALFTGDMEERVESTLVLGKAPLSSDILKVPHHGSKTSSSTGFLLAVAPKLAVISVGKNSYGHPSPAVLQRYQNLGIRVRRTDAEGDVTVTWE